MVPDLTSKGGVLAGIVNGWQISGITSWNSGVPYNIGFSGDIAGAGMENAWYGTRDHEPFRVVQTTASASTISPTFSCSPGINQGNSVGDKIVDIRCVGIPAFPDSGPYVAPYYLRFPSRMNWDITLFKNFNIGDGGKKLQFRVGFFNIFNQAAPGTTSGQDIDLTLDTTCNVRVNGVPNGSGGTSDNICDPTGGFSFTQNTLDNYGKIILQRGKRVIELALKFYF